LPGAAIHKVTAEFCLSGSFDDYDAAAQTAIKTVLAKDAAVQTNAVSLSIVPGSVLVTANLFFGSQSGADFAVSQLTEGALSSTSALEAAINAQFTAAQLDVTTTVHDLIAPFVVDASGSSSGAIIGAAAGGGAVLLLLIAVVSYYKLWRRAKPNAKPQSLTKIGRGAQSGWLWPSATVQAGAESAEEIAEEVVKKGPREIVPTLKEMDDKLTQELGLSSSLNLMQRIDQACAQLSLEQVTQDMPLCDKAHRCWVEIGTGSRYDV